MEDARFSKFGTEKKFRTVAKKHKKVKIDKRFGSLFTSKKFASKVSVDKRGRPQHLSSKESYEKFYDIEKSESSESGDDDDLEDKNDNIVKEPEESSGEEGEEIEDAVRTKLQSSTDYARGEGNLYSDSSSEEESDEDAEENKEGEYFDKWGELDGDAETTEEETARLAVCNMDWDRVGAEDIFLALSSFCPAAGSITGVEIFLSDFGRERLADEEALGPRELREEQEREGEGEGNGETASMERVRQYQVNRLKYYYAVVTFDTIATASRVYEECNGSGFELSGTTFDLRFVPADMEFSSPASACRSLPQPDRYKPKGALINFD